MHKYKPNDFLKIISQNSQLDQLNQSLNEATSKLSAAEEQKKTFEIETQSLNEKIVQMINDLEQRSTKLNELESESAKKVIKNLTKNQCCLIQTFFYRHLNWSNLINPSMKLQRRIKRLKS